MVKTMWVENPALYEVAKKVCHDMGLPWTDPRTGRLYPPPRTRKKTTKPNSTRSRRPSDPAATAPKRRSGPRSS